MDPQTVRDALTRMKAGEATADVLGTIVSAAEAFATLEPEYVFRSPQAGLYYVTQNDMLAETLEAARPEERVLVRLAPPYPDWPETNERESNA